MVRPAWALGLPHTVLRYPDSSAVQERMAWSRLSPAPANQPDGLSVVGSPVSTAADALSWIMASLAFS
jgi:hypothetical protein